MDTTWLRSRPPEAIEGSGFTLHRVREAHVDAVAAAIRSSLAHLQPWMIFATDDYSTEDASQWQQQSDLDWEEGRSMNHAIIEQGVDGVSGIIGMHNRVRRGWLEMGYWVRGDRIGRALSRRAAVVLVEQVRAHMPEVVGIEIHHDVENVASASVPAALGFSAGQVVPAKFSPPASSGSDQVWTLRLR